VHGVARQIIKSTDKKLKDTLIITPNNKKKNCKLYEEEMYSNCIK